MTVVYTVGLPHSDIQESYRLLTTPPGFSQPTTSFFGSVCLGIPRVLFLASFEKIMCDYFRTAGLPRLVTYYTVVKVRFFLF